MDKLSERNNPKKKKEKALEILNEAKDNAVIKKLPFYSPPDPCGFVFIFVKSESPKGFLVPEIF